jgi:hypothetical protein
MRFLKKEGEIAILDGSNSTEFRRKLIRDRVNEEVRRAAPSFFF